MSTKNIRTEEELIPVLNNDILVKGARVHNLKNVTVTFPRNKLIVVTGVESLPLPSIPYLQKANAAMPKA